MKFNINFLYFSSFIAILCILTSCEPHEVDDIELPAPPTADFAYEYWADNANYVIFTSTGDEGFQYFWDYGTGLTSTLKTDTAYFPVAGVYEVSLTVSNRGGAGTATQSVTIAQSDNALCNDNTTILLTGGCNDVDGNRWTFSTVAGAVIVGPTRGSSEWYSSPENGLDADQADDTYDFIFDDNQFDYNNNGLTIYPECGYEAKPFPTDPDARWTLSPGTGFQGVDQIILPDGAFMGTKDSGPIYDILSISETELVVESELLGGGGYFNFRFVKVE